MPKALVCNFQKLTALKLRTLLTASGQEPPFADDCSVISNGAEHVISDLTKSFVIASEGILIQPMSKLPATCQHLSN